MTELEKWVVKHNILGDMDDYVIDFNKSIFYGWSHLSKIDFTNIPPVKIISLGKNDFGDSLALEATVRDRITDVIIPNTVEKIGSLSFRRLENIHKVVIPKSVKNIERSAFKGCSNLTEVDIYPETTNIAHNAFEGTPFLNNILDKYGYWIHNDVLIAGRGLYDYSSNRRILMIPNDVRVLQPECCKYSDMGEVFINDIIEEIPYCCFAGCTMLENIHIGPRVTNIGDCAFCNCATLSEIEIPENVKYIGKEAFESCYNLSEVVLHEGLRLIAPNAFRGCVDLRKIKIPKGCGIYKSAFTNIPNIDVYVHNDSNVCTDYGTNNGHINIIRYN